MRHVLHRLLILIAIASIPMPGMAATADGVPPDMNLYVRARAAQLDGDDAQAASLYKQLKSPVLAEAGACYTAECLAKLGKRGAATAAYQAYLQHDAYQLYRGEALLGLSRLCCLQAEQPAGYEAALKHLDAAMKWLAEVDKPKSGVLAATTVSSTLPSQPNGTKWHAPISPSLIGPRDVVNAHTAHWYRPLLQSRLLLLKVYVLARLDHADKAKAAFDHLHQLNTTGKRAWVEPDVLAGLSTDLERGAFFIPPQAWQSLTKAHAASLRFAFFRLTTRQWLLAKPLFAKVDKETANGKGRADDWAAAELGLGVCAYRTGYRSNAIKHFKKFENLLRSTSLGRFGRLMLANVYAGNRNTYKSAARLYGGLVSSQGAEPTPEQARIIYAIAAAEHHDDVTCRKMADALDQKNPRSKEAELAHQLLDLLGAQPVHENDAAQVDGTSPAAAGEAPIELSTFAPPLKSRIGKKLHIRIVRWQWQATPFVPQMILRRVQPFIPLTQPQPPANATVCWLLRPN